MKKRFENIYQFRIDLKNTRPPVWRRIQVPETYTFWDLHVAIQDAMGWLDCHLHEFDLTDPAAGEEVRIGIPTEDFGLGKKILPGRDKKISEYFTMENKKADYTYDFGDDWEHKVKLEKIMPREKRLRYPKCIAGKRACPPEDCGGVWGYEDICRGEHGCQEGYEDYEPERFNIKEVHFDDPGKRYKIAFEGADIV